MPKPYKHIKVLTKESKCGTLVDLLVLRVTHERGLFGIGSLFWRSADLIFSLSSDGEESGYMINTSNPVAPTHWLYFRQANPPETVSVPKEVWPEFRKLIESYNEYWNGED